MIRFICCNTARYIVDGCFMDNGGGCFQLKWYNVCKYFKNSRNHTNPQPLLLDSVLLVIIKNLVSA